MDYSFNIDLAKIYGVEEAVLLNHLYYWIQHNAAPDANGFTDVDPGDIPF